MRRLFVYALLFAAATQLIGCATMCPSCHKSQEMIASAQALDHRFIEAFNKGDVDAAMENYWNSPDLVIYPSASPAGPSSLGDETGRNSSAEAVGRS
ncbi:MAG: hypothetical protein V2A74_05075 [bacterium]